ncbi:ankyrin repeat-containing domain protein [Xylariaceae sp. FL0255]|nr:ankyrin repeat-containing domain protein [Xylariaceae sp. FL0255]
MPRFTSKPTETQWLEHKRLIRRLYLTEEKPLEDVVDVLLSLGMKVTDHQLEYKLKKWKFRKNIDKKTWISIGHIIAKRKLDYKESEVIHSGKRVKSETVDKETDRHRDKSTNWPLTSRRSPSPLIWAESQVTVCTPQPLPMEFEWPKTLPWLLFSSGALPKVIASSRSDNSKSNDTPPNKLVSIILPRENAPGAVDISNLGVSRLAAIIGRSMPETYPEENLQRAQSLLHGSCNEAFLECLSMVIYAISNNSFDLYNDDKWDTLIVVLRNRRIFYLDVDLKSLRSSTINAFMEKLGSAAAFRILRGDREAATTFKWLLSAGHCPNLGVKTLWDGLIWFFGEKSTIFHLATQEMVLESLQSLFDAGANPDLLLGLPNRKPQALLECALDIGLPASFTLRVADVLLEHGASMRINQTLQLAIRSKNRELTEKILRKGANIFAELEPDGPFLYKETALSIAAATDLPNTQYIWTLLQSSNPPKPCSDLVTPDVLIAAAAEGNNDVLSYLYHLSQQSLSSNAYGITPLHAAARRGHESTCRALLQMKSAAHSNTRSIYSPLHCASYGGHQGVVHLLVNSANINTVADFGIEKLTGLETENRLSMSRDLRSLPRATPLATALLAHEKWYLQSAKWGCCAALLIRAGASLVGDEVCLGARTFHRHLLEAALSAGADPNELDSSGNRTALQYALQISEISLKMPETFSSSRETVTLLLRHGARLLGGELVSAIEAGDFGMANFLLGHGAGLMETDQSGATVLEAAILSPWSELVFKILNSSPNIYEAGALCAAIVTKNDVFIEHLLRNRPLRAISDPLEVTLIALAARYGSLDLLRALLAYPLPYASGPMPFVLSWKGELESVALKPLRNKRWLKGSPLSLVVERQTPKALEVLSVMLESGLGPDKLTWAIASGSNNIAAAQRLLDHSQGWKDEDIENNVPSPLLAAIKHNNKELVALLLKAGAWVNEHRRAQEYSRSPLQLACELGNFDIAGDLIQAGANINSPPAMTGGATPLQFAAIGGHLSLAKYLVDLDAQINALPGQRLGRTALQGASEHGRLDMVGFLLANGTLTSGRQWRSRFVIAVKLAIRNQHYAVADLLKQSAGWSDEDESSLETIDVDYDYGSPLVSIDVDSDYESNFNYTSDEDDTDTVMEECDGGTDSDFNW